MRKEERRGEERRGEEGCLAVLCAAKGRAGVGWDTGAMRGVPRSSARSRTASCWWVLLRA
jgi:hypothetical protein